MSQDRNQKARDEFALARQRKMFQDELAAGTAAVHDRFGNPLKEGDRCLINFTLDPIAEVVKVGPVLDPRAPVGAMQIIFAITVPQQVPANQPMTGVVKIGERAAVGSAMAAAAVADDAGGAVGEAPVDTPADVEDPPAGAPIDAIDTPQLGEEPNG